jgi:hypothetical protein
LLFDCVIFYLAQARSAMLNHNAGRSAYMFIPYSSEKDELDAPMALPAFNNDSSYASVRAGTGRYLD